VEDHDNLFVMAETVHFLGIAVLAYKLVRKRNSGGEFLGREGSEKKRRSPQGPFHTHAHTLTPITTTRALHPPSRPPTPTRTPGLSLQSQYLTAAFLATRLACSFMMEYDIHTALDFATLGATGWVIWQLRGPCAGTFQAEQDSLAWYWVVR
jgi:ER lumen protein retaining receptor